MTSYVKLVLNFLYYKTAMIFMMRDVIPHFYFQPLVPAVSAEDGEWIISRQFMPVCKPGGHGVIWKLAYNKGVFQWFRNHGRKGATVRQVR